MDLIDAVGSSADWMAVGPGCVRFSDFKRIGPPLYLAARQVAGAPIPVIRPS